MHRHHSSEPGYYRGWLTIGLPTNPICWLLGHRPRPVITRWRFNIDPSLWIECRVCATRYWDRDRHVNDLTPAEAKAALARRVRRAEEDPVAFVSGVERRDGWPANRLELHHDVHWPTRDGKRRGFGKFGVRFHVGGKSSETPFDGHLTAGPFGYYWSVGGVGGRLASWLGRGHKRDLSLSVHGNTLWWKLWHDDDGGHDDGAHDCDKRRSPKVWPWSAGREKYRSWMCLREGNIELNPLDAFWGSPTYAYKDLMKATVTVPVAVGQFPGDTYLVKMKLQHVTRGRTVGPGWARRARDCGYAVAWDTAGLNNGIPFRNESWKGDTVLASAVNMPKEFELSSWSRLAAEELARDIVGMRKRSRFVPPTVGV